MNNFKYKYIKYKNKYLKLKNQHGSASFLVHIPPETIIDQDTLFFNQFTNYINYFINSDNIPNPLNNLSVQDIINKIIHFNLENRDNQSPPYQESILSNNINESVDNQSIHVYKNYFNSFNEINNINTTKRYKKLYNINNSIININNINKKIKSSILSKVDFDNQKIFYGSLKEYEKYVYNLHKNNSNILTDIFRQNSIELFKKYINNIYHEKFATLPFEKKKYKDLLITQPISLHYTNIINIPIFKIINIAHYLYKKAPPIKNPFYIYRAEEKFDGRKPIEINKNYIFEGFTSFSTDPKVGFTFNKTLYKNGDDYIMDYVFKVYVPENAKIIIPSIGRYGGDGHIIDPEFEILLNCNKAIKILSIEKDIVFNIINMEFEELSVKVLNFIKAELIIDE